jgi:hypothetical protein
MKKMDYSMSGSAGFYSASALGDRAKARTPEPLRFADRAGALVFLKAAQAEGCRFSGADTVDPEQKLVKNRYFIAG